MGTRIFDSGVLVFGSSAPIGGQSCLLFASIDCQAMRDMSCANGIDRFLPLACLAPAVTVAVSKPKSDYSDGFPKLSSSRFFGIVIAL